MPDGYYHVHTRGNDRQRITFGNWSGMLFVRELERAAARYSWRVLAFCLMDNHYHLILQIRDGGLSDGMRDFNGRFAQETNLKEKRTNHLFGKRFTSWLIEDESYLFESIRYTLLNPVRAGSVVDPRAWRASSMRAMTGNVRPPTCLDVRWIFSHFDDNPKRAPASFIAFVLDGIGRERPARHPGMAKTELSLRRE